MSETTCRVCSAPTDGFICARDATKLARACGDFASLLGELAKVRARQTNVYRSGVGQRRPEPVYDPERNLPAWLRTKDGRVALRPTTMPVDLDASELEWTAWNTITTWARDLAEHRGETGPDARNVLTWLATFAEAFRWQDNAAEAFDELTALHRDLERAVDASPQRVYAGPCSREECDRDLYAWPTSDTITCDGWRGDGIGCAATYSRDERAEWLRAEIANNLVTLEEFIVIRPALFPDLPDVPRATVLSWAKNGRVEGKGRNRVGEERYSGRELIDLAANYKPKRFATRTRRCA